ncbi:hypothetical protein A2870_01545 [Candidatus Curtissbacteria bacterium RIFCSPHIGHO2_01_FULL_41_11]|uniref:Uncharacterized protein n=1 Tax=Candidatus Curtissbacteria bacterium RIFCSPHIGHO2_01_FULL_41_11 TaxID=1797711 RepID=A0A1F5G6A0_9BACT|nr:MAG: hypothetical protein A2870_01545 [Candidatus Curtissbacteria bacterium RIFCSPHIGHO2_01_FULL_41_11]
MSLEFESKSAKDLFGGDAVDFVGADYIQRFFKVADDLKQLMQNVRTNDLEIRIAPFGDEESGFGILIKKDGSGYAVFHNFNSDQKGIWVSDDQIQKYKELMGLLEEGTVG